MNLETTWSSGWAFDIRKREWEEVLAERMSADAPWQAVEQVSEWKIALGPLRLSLTDRHGYRIVRLPSSWPTTPVPPGRESWAEATDPNRKFTWPEGRHWHR